MKPVYNPEESIAKASLGMGAVIVLLGVIYALPGGTLDSPQVTTIANIVIGVLSWAIMTVVGMFLPGLLYYGTVLAFVPLSSQSNIITAVVSTVARFLTVSVIILLIVGYGLVLSLYSSRAVTEDLIVLFASYDQLSLADPTQSELVASMSVGAVTALVSTLVDVLTSDE